MIVANVLPNGEIVTSAVVVSNSVNFEEVKFVFPENWDGLTKTAVFTKGSKTVSIILDDNNELYTGDDTCLVPHEIITPPEFAISVFGYLDGVRATSARGTVTVIPSGYELGDAPQPPTPTVYEQIVDIINDTKEIAQSVRDDADEGEFDGKSAYEVAIENGFVGTEAEWILSLQGEDGEDGVSGVIVSETEPADEDIKVWINPNGDADVFSPTVEIQEITDGHRVIVTDVEGEKSFEVMNGPKGDKGENGIDGKSAYEIALDEGFIGTEAEWLNSIKGEKGDIGPQGIQGEAGPQGEQGPPGPKGNDGTVSFENLTPEQKESLKGEAADLTDYVKNTDYATDSKAGVVKVRGDGAFGIIMEANKNLMIKMASNAGIDARASTQMPIVPNNLEYAVKSALTTNHSLTLTEEEQSAAQEWLGITGSADIPIIQAEAGANIGSVGTPTVTANTSGDVTTFTFNYLKGARGNTGAKGDKGDTGAQGIQGIQGEKGEKGDTGPQGIQGDKGEKGDKGDKGDTPVKGTDYFTDADKTEIINAVITALPKYAGEVI